MDIHRLVSMANEIAAFFAAEPDKAEAARMTANHISRFWERRMRREIVAHHAAGGAGLNDVARAAVALISTETLGEVRTGKERLGPVKRG